VTASAVPVRFWCGRCEQPLALINTLWKSPDGDYRCAVGGIPVTEGGRVVHVEKVMHDIRSSWVHPAMRETDDDEKVA
jgi:hypothetical protein